MFLNLKMKSFSLSGKALVFALMLVLVLAQDPPTNADCKFGNLQYQYFLDPSDCTAYYQCFDIGGGEWYLLHATCPIGGIWDQASTACVMGECENPSTGTPVPSETTPTITTTTVPPYSCLYEGRFSDPFNCHGYYQCVVIRGLWYRNSYICPANSYFSNVTKQCTYGTCPP